MPENLKQFVDSLDALPEDGDQEISHGDADNILLQCLREAGLGEVADAWQRARDRVGFWYA